MATFPQLEYPRRWPSIRPRDGAALLRAARRGGRDARGGWAAGGGRALARRRTPSARCCGPRWRGWRTSRCGCWRRPTGARPSEPIEVPDNAVLMDWLPYSQAMAAADLVISHGGHGTVVRALSLGRAGARLPGRGATWRRTGRGSHGPARACRCRGGCVSPRGVRLAARRILGDPCYRERAEAIAAWSRANDGAASAAARRGGGQNASSRLAPARVLSRHRGSGGGTRTHNLSVNSRALYQLSYPG